MRLRAKIDHNQNTIVQQLRQVGATVQSLSTIGKGCPDILVGFRGNNFLLEIKNPEQAMSARKLTPDEEKFFETWEGQKAIIETIDQALKAIGAIK